MAGEDPTVAAGAAGGDGAPVRIDHRGGSLERPTQARIAAVATLCAGTGVIDVAGGSGHVSLAFALEGVHSTASPTHAPPGTSIHPFIALNLTPNPTPNRCSLLPCRMPPSKAHTSVTELIPHSQP
jgi:hypothetical protein